MRQREGWVQEGGRARPVMYLDGLPGVHTEVAIWTLVLIVLGLLVMVWGAAELSSWLGNGARANVGMGEAAIAMARLGAYKFDWDRAWSPETREALAGPRWFWGAFIAEAAMFSLLFWPAWRIVGPRPAEPMPVAIYPTPQNNPRTVRTRSRREYRQNQRMLGPSPPADEQPGPEVPPGGRPDGGPILPPAPVASRLVVDDPPSRQLVLGRAGSQLVAADQGQAVIAFGPTGSGKTAALAVPAILEWDGPALVCTSKPDLVHLSWDGRCDRGGQTWLFDPSATMKRPGSGPGSRHPMRRYGWSPLQALAALPREPGEADLSWRTRQWALAQRTADMMVQASGHMGGQAGGGESGTRAAAQLLAPMLLAAVATDQPMGQVADWLDRRDERAVTAALERVGVADARAAWESGRGLAPSTAAAAAQTLSLTMAPYLDPGLAGLPRDDQAQINVRHLLDGRPNTLYLYAAPDHRERFQPLLATLLSQAADATLARAASSGGSALNPPLLVVIDGTVHCTPPAVLDHLANAGSSGAGIQVLSLFTGLLQLERAFGREQALRTADNHRARLALPSLDDTPTLSYLSSISRDGGAWIPVLEGGEAVLLHGELPPLSLALRPWQSEESLRRRVQGGRGGGGPVTDSGRRRWRGPRPWVRPPRGPQQVDADDALLPPGTPDPLNSEANDREAARYWEAVEQGGTLPGDRANPSDDTWGRPN
ncbi:MAG: type IV secretory system conjugative DNA transfer family protein [Acidimicrobiia bacterium]|nr:type IV secretory system conjugative DNA transfer family protein [Acidimicrobiia bacterium]